MLWQTIVEGFRPWLQTVLVQKVANQPWIADDRDSATHMVKALVDVVAFAHHIYAGWLGYICIFTLKLNLQTKTIAL